MSDFSFVIHGEPVAKGRPQFSVIGGKPIARTPAKTRRYEDIVRHTAMREWGGKKPVDCAVAVNALFVRAVPQSWPKKRQAAALSGEHLPTGRPDADNLLKSVTDGLNGVVYLDDSQIVTLSVRKIYGTDPRAVINVVWDEPEPTPHQAALEVEPAPF